MDYFYVCRLGSLVQPLIHSASMMPKPSIYQEHSLLVVESSFQWFIVTSDIDMSLQIYSAFIMPRLFINQVVEYPAHYSVVESPWHHQQPWASLCEGNHIQSHSSTELAESIAEDEHTSRSGILTDTSTVNSTKYQGNHIDVFKPNIVVCEGEETFEFKPPAPAAARRHTSVCEGDVMHVSKPCLVCEGEETRTNTTVSKANEGAHVHSATMPTINSIIGAAMSATKSHAPTASTSETIRQRIIQAMASTQAKQINYGFLRASTMNFSRPTAEEDSVVLSYDGYSSYSAVRDEASCKLFLFLCESKEPPIETMSDFLTVYGLEAGGVLRCDQGGELARLIKFKTAVL